MLLLEREEVILSLVNEHGVVSVRELAGACEATEVTIRRDLNRLEARNLLRRTHGGAVRFDKALPGALPRGYVTPASIDDIPDALILAPVQNSAVHTLRERALRNRIPLLAESSAFPGAIYLGPNNYEAAFTLGQWAGDYVQQHMGGFARVLDISQSVLANTRERSKGFADGLRSILADSAHMVTIDGRGLYNEAYQVALDALRIHPEINVIFGINDDSVLGGLQAYLDLARDPDQLVAVNIGGEGKTLFDRLQLAGPLKACMGLFPEVVGRSGIDAVLRLWAGEDIGSEIITPSALITAETLTDYYTPTGHGWKLNWQAVESLPQTCWDSPLPAASNRRISFVVHYCTHEWYQNLAKAMQARAAQVGVMLSVEDVKDDLSAEIRDLRRLIGKLAATYVNDHDTIILDSGTPTTYMAQFLQGYRDLTVITNSLAVFQNLQNDPEITVILTGGEFRRDSQSFVGRGGQLLLREIRADKAFVVAGGVSPSFGISSKNVLEAEMRQAMINAAREVVVLADHTVLGVDSNVRVADLGKVHTLITDAGTRAVQRLDFNQRGIRVMVAGQLLNGVNPQADYLETR
jgi:DeoR/GlpR family transcriptional regulator of sugar metabolism